jgi:ribosomal protein S18 acetylase RimI-like enzyme
VDQKAGTTERGNPATVRRAAAGDEAMVRSLRLEALADSPAAFDSTLERELTRTPSDWERWLAHGATFVALEAGAPDGIACGVPHPDDPTAMFLMSLWVRPRARGRGAGSALVAAVLSWAEEAGKAVAWLHVGKDNEPARRLYERHGFRATGQTVVRKRDGAVELEMRRAVGRGTAS